MLTPNLAEHLRETIRDLERVKAANPNDPDFLELKQIIQTKVDEADAKEKASAKEEHT